MDISILGKRRAVAQTKITEITGELAAILGIEPPDPLGGLKAHQLRDDPDLGHLVALETEVGLLNKILIVIKERHDEQREISPGSGGAEGRAGRRSAA